MFERNFHLPKWHVHSPNFDHLESIKAWFRRSSSSRRYDTSRAGQAAGGSSKREKNYKPKKGFAYRIVCDNLDWLNLFLITRTKLAFVGFVTTRNCMWQQVLDDATKYYSSTTKYYSSTLLVCTTKYYKVLSHYYFVLQSFTSVLPCTTKHYKVLLQYSRLRCTTKYYSSTTKYYSSTTKYCKEPLHYYSALQSTTPVLLLLRTTK